MKRIAFFIFNALIGTTPLLSQNINIPDQCFVDALIENGVDTNKDGLISFAEAEAVERLDIWSECIRDIRGIEAFLNLTCPPWRKFVSGPCPSRVRHLIM